MKRWQVIGREDWWLFVLVGVFAVAEIMIIVQAVREFATMTPGDRLGMAAGGLVIVPGIVAVFLYLWARVAREGSCPKCGQPMVRLPRPKGRGQYRHGCEACGHTLGTGVYPAHGSEREPLGRKLIDASKSGGRKGKRTGR